jgi:DNA-binding transcriptional ArsR family regulator
MKDARNVIVFDQTMVEIAKVYVPAQKNLEQLGDFFKVLADPTRLKILYALRAGELCVFDLSVSVEASVSSVSHHLSALKHVRLVKGRRDGRIVYYSLDDDHINSIIQIAWDHLED